MKRFVMLFITLCCLASCEEEPESYRSRFYPVIKDGTTWEINEIFNDRPISLRLESRFESEQRLGTFKPIALGNTELSLDKDILYQGGVIQKGENLLDYDLAEIELFKVPLNNGEREDSYIFWINKENNSSFYLNNCCYYTVYLSSITEDNLAINDSTVIKIEN